MKLRRSPGVFSTFRSSIQIARRDQKVTTPVQSQKKLQTSEIRYRRLFEAARDGILILNAGTLKIIDVNPFMTELLGYPRGDFLGKELWELGFFSDKTSSKASFDELQKMGYLRYDDLPLKTSGGESCQVEFVSNVYDEDGVKVIQCNIRDITERKLAAEELSKSEDRYRDLVENAIDIIYTQDLAGNYTSVNKAGEEITGYTRKESLTMNLAQVVAPEYREKAAQMIAAKIAGEAVPPYEIEVIAKDGSRVAVEINTRAIYENGVPVGIQGIARDITERKRTVDALREAERKYRSIFENSNDGIFQNTPDGRFLSANPAFARMLGFSSPEELIRERTDLKHQNYADPALHAKLKRLLEKQSFVTGLEYEVFRKDGTLIWVSENTRVIRDAAGQAVYYEGSVQDITERKRAEALLKESRQSLALATESARIGIWDWDVPANKLVWDTQMYTLYGIREQDFSGAYSAWQSGLHPDDRERADADIKAALDDVRGFHTEFRVVWPNGEVRHIEAHALVQRSKNGAALRMIGVNWDITARKQLEEQLRQSHKMEAVGVLAGGIAHDFNNLLTVINGYSDLTLKKMAADDPSCHNIEEVREAGSRAAALIAQLLVFSRKQVLKPIVHNINSVISNIEKMLRRIIRENIELRIVLDAELGNIKADPGQIEQVIMNLAVNARDAMPNGGTLTIETQNVNLDKDYASQHIAVTPGPFVKMIVTDTGKGIDQQTQLKMFEPFFTTKDVGKGTGLGLSTVFGIVKQSGGDIMVYSELGHGTTFKIYLPCVDEPVQKPRWVGDADENLFGRETILLVEDEEIVRNLVSEILTGNGYHILEADSGEAALSICAKYSQPIHLLVTDVIMSGISGPTLKDQISELLPDIKVLFMSGYTDDSIASKGLLDSSAAFIEKPFSPDGLSRKVREILTT